MAVFAYKSGQFVPCYSPLRGYYGRSVNPATGRRPIVFSLAMAFSGVAIDLPCGQCIGCRLERARQWALRIVHEKRLHSQSAFLTLTYSDRNLPKGRTLVLADIQKFMKRLRKRRPQGLRFYACGEYGEITHRPHYHCLLLNTSFEDLRFYKQSKTGHRLYVSAELSSLWTAGDHWIGEVTFESAAYCARYVTKKVTGDLAAAHYGGRLPEFTCMSRNPGLGLGWFERFQAEAYRRDSAVANGREVRLPRYYDTKFEDIDSARLADLKVQRRRAALVHRADATPERRRVRERFTELSMDRFKREI